MSTFGTEFTVHPKSKSSDMARMVKSIFDPGIHTSTASAGLLLLRLVSGAFMFAHGDGKLVRLFGDAPIKFSDPFGIGAEASLALTVFAEVICSILVILGMATRFAVIPVIITMFVAAFIAHAGDPFGSKELPLLYAAVFIVIGLTGAGRYSADNIIYRKI